jgi:hypothetical protein
MASREYKPGKSPSGRSRRVRPGLRFSGALRVSGFATLPRANFRQFPGGP